MSEENVPSTHDHAATPAEPDRREPARVSRAELVRLLRRAGYPIDRIDDIAAQLPDPVEVERACRLLEHYGLTRDRLMDRMGASP